MAAIPCEPIRVLRKSPWLLLRQGAIFLGAALAYPLLVYGPLDFDWTPLLLGVVYLLAVLAGWGETRPGPREVTALAVAIGAVIVLADHVACCASRASTRWRSGSPAPY